MTLLAPDIITAIVEGRQPRHVNLHALRGRIDVIPRDWNKQRRLLGFSERKLHIAIRVTGLCRHE